MISTWHLLWIVPLAASAGAFVLAIFNGGDCDPVQYDDEYYDHRESGLLEDD